MMPTREEADEAAKICLTYSFNTQTTDVYIGKFDTTDEELKMIQDANTLKRRRGRVFIQW